MNLPGILGLARSIEYLITSGINKIEAHNLMLRNKLYEGLSGCKDLTIVSPEPGSSASQLLLFRLNETIESTAFSAMLLEKHNLSVRAVHKQSFNGIRFSLHTFNTEKDVEFAVKTVRKELES